jgi:hypothetical protein
MTVINPFIGALLQTPQVQRQQVDAKASQVRRQQELQRNVAAEGDRFTHTVESPEELKPVHEERDDAKHHKKKRRTPQDAEDESPTDDPPPHVDVKA